MTAKSICQCRSKYGVESLCTLLPNSIQSFTCENTLRLNLPVAAFSSSCACKCLTLRLVSMPNWPTFAILSDNYSDIVRAISKSLGTDEGGLYILHRGRVIQHDLTLTEQFIPSHEKLECYMMLKGGGHSEQLFSQTKLQFSANKKRCGGLSRANIGDYCPPTGKSVQVLPVMPNPNPTLPTLGAGGAEEVRSASADVDPLKHGLWIEDVNQAKKVFIQIDEQVLRSITSVRELELCINQGLNRDQNESCLKFLGLQREMDEYGPVLVVERVNREGLHEEKPTSDPWSYDHFCAQQAQSQLSSTVLISEVSFFSFTFEHCSQRCKLILGSETFCHRSDAENLYQCLGMCAPKKRKRDQYIDIIRHGLMGERGIVRYECRKQQSESTIVRPESQSIEPSTVIPVLETSKKWLGNSFSSTIYPEDIDLKDNDCMPDGSFLSVAQLSLFQKYETMNQGYCVLRHRLSGVKIDIGNDAKAYKYLQLFCRNSVCRNSRPGCSYRANFELIPGPRRPDEPIFIRRGKCCELHTCCPIASALDCKKSFQGKTTLKRETLDMACILYANGESLKHIMLALGHDESNYMKFEMDQKKLYDSIRNKRLAAFRTQLPRLRALINEMLADGRLAYAAMLAPPRCEGKYWFYWSLFENSFDQKLQHVDLVSFDFKYQLIDGQAFGVITIRSQSGNIIPNALFLVDSENQEAVAWIVKQYQNNHDRLAMKLNTRV